MIPYYLACPMCKSYIQLSMVNDPAMISSENKIIDFIDDHSPEASNHPVYLLHESQIPKGYNDVETIDDKARRIGRAIDYYYTCSQNYKNTEVFM